MRRIYYSLVVISEIFLNNGLNKVINQTNSCISRNTVQYLQILKFRAI